MKIKLNKEDINTGKPYDCESCPIAIAFERETNHPCRVADSIIDMVTLKVYRFPEIARQFIIAFDNGHYPAPIEFKIIENEG